MTENLTIVGKVATDPTAGRTPSGIPVTNFRLASTHRRFDQVSGTWIDAETNWFSVAAFRQLAEHAQVSLRTGDSVIVTGRLKIRNWEANGKHGTSVDIDAEAIGHDLRWGTSNYMPRSRMLGGSRGYDTEQATTRGETPAPTATANDEAEPADADVDVNASVADAAADDEIDTSSWADPQTSPASVPF